ncbi:hypothetical protein [Pseudomonas nicosulfuronedens]
MTYCSSSADGRMVLFFIFALSTTATAGEACDDIDKNSYKNESRVFPEGGVYGVVGRGRAYFYSAPDGACKKQIFVLPGDKVQVYTESNGYFSVMHFKSDGGTEEGWFLKKRLARSDENSVHH